MSLLSLLHFFRDSTLNVQERQWHAPSVIVIVSFYKPSGSIAHLVLKAHTWGVPNRTAIFQDWAHQSFICCVFHFHLLWTSVKILSQGSKSPVSLSANTADMCILSQIICHSDAKILDTLAVFEDRSLQSIWSIDLFDQFPCYLHHIAFDRLKSHTYFLAQHPNWSISFWSFNVSSVSLIQSSAKSYYRINVCWDIINV